MNRMKKILFWLSGAAFVMLVLPWIAVTWIKGDGGMAACFLLFFAVDPAFSIIMGASAGKDVRARWFLPLISPLFFLAGTWLFFDMGETAFLLYASIYLILGMAAMLISVIA